MALMDDRQLGHHLAAALPKEKGADRESVIAVLRRLLPADDPLLEPLVALVQGRQFQDLASGSPGGGPSPEKREALLRSLAATQPAPLVARLESVLEGCFPAGATGGAPPLSETEWQQHMRAMEEANIHRAQGAQGSQGAREAQKEQGEQAPVGPGTRIPVLLVGTLAAGASLVALGLGMMVWGHRICGTFGICSVVTIQATVTALEQAQGAASRLAAAQTLADYDQSLGEVERYLQRVENEAVLSETQRLRLQLLEEKAREGRVRLKREKEDQQIVRRVGADRASLERLPASQAMERRNDLRSQLEGIAPSSFSHPQALTLRQALQPPPASPPASPQLQSPSAAGPTQGARLRGSRPRWVPPAAVEGRPEAGSGDAPLRPEPLW
jgi:hypothetical protein